MVLAKVPDGLASIITADLWVPTIGIGASVACDGQVLVTDDMLGMFDRTAKFVRRYDDLAARIDTAAGAYAAEVRARSFPGEAEVYRPKAT